MVDFYGVVDPAVEMWNTLLTDVANKPATIKNHAKAIKKNSK